MIVFSLLLLGSTGLVLDAGRVYTQHSQLQAYSDQMAIAAANELDGQPDSIERAVKAVFGRDGEPPFLRKVVPEYGEFQVASIAFFAVMLDSDAPQSDMTEAFPGSNMLARASRVPGQTVPSIVYAGDDQENTSRAALFAVVQTQQGATQSVVQRIANLLLTMGNNPKPTFNGTRDRDLPEFESTLTFDAVSAASLIEMSCAEMSTLVFCNPWEDIAPSPLEVDPQDPLYSVPGRSLQYFAPNFPNVSSRAPVKTGSESFVNSVYDWDVNHQLFNLSSPLADDSGVCDLLVNLRLDGEDYMTARDRCLMAKAHADQVCWGTDIDLTITPAHGPSVQRAINTIFDIWLEPFEGMLEDAGSAQVGSGGIAVRELFEPDILAVTPYELADWFTTTGTDPEGEEGPGSMQDGLTAEEFESIGTSGGPAFAGHLSAAPNLILKAGISQFALVDECHIGTYDAALLGSTSSTTLAAPCENDFIGDHFEGAGGSSGYPQQNLEDYWLDTYQVTTIFTPDAAGQGSTNQCGTSQEEQTPGYAEFCNASNVPTSGELDTWYEMYQRERELLVDVDTIDSSSRVTDPNFGGKWCNDDSCGTDYVTRYSLAEDGTEPFIKQYPHDYYGITGASSLFQPGRERRRMRSAMVNCGAVTDRFPDTDGAYTVETNELRLMDVYIPMPVGADCGLEPDPSGVLSTADRAILSCDPDDAMEQQMFVEIIEDVSDEITRQYTAHLVR